MFKRWGLTKPLTSPMRARAAAKESTLEEADRLQHLVIQMEMLRRQQRQKPVRAVELRAPRELEVISSSQNHRNWD